MSNMAPEGLKCPDAFPAPLAGTAAAAGGWGCSFLCFGRVLPVQGRSLGRSLILNELAQ